MATLLSDDAEGIARAAEWLRGGACVAIPTETVYGLAARADSADAVAAIYRAKGRPSFNPLIVHVASLAMAERLAVVGYDNTPVAAMPLVGLSSIEQRGEDLAHVAAKALLSRLAGRTEAEHLLLEPHLFARRSLRGGAD